MSLMKLTTISLLACFILGCANNSAFLKASTKVQNGEYEGFTDLKRIVDEHPENVRYKNYYFRQRELAISHLNKRAETAMSHAQWDEARYHYQRILVIDPYSERGLKALKALALRESNAKNIQEAKKLINEKDLTGAKEKLKWVVNQEPNNHQALDMLDDVNRKILEKSHYLHKVKSKFKKPISLEFKEAKLKDVFDVLSRASGVNFVLDNALKGDTLVSVYVKNTSIDHALNNIFSANQLSRKVLDETTVLVYPNKKKSEYEAIMAKTFYLKSVEAKKAQELLKTVLGMKEVFVDDKVNVLIVKDTVENVRIVEKLINSYDIGDPEVLLEVEVLEISSTLASEIGLRWPSQISASIAGDAGGGQLTLDEIKDMRSGMTTISISNPQLAMTLRGTSGESNLLANPKIRVRNREQAKIHIGDRVPVITNTTTATGIVSESISYLDVGLKLDVEPSIKMDDEVSIKLSLEVSNIVSEIATETSVAYRLGTRNAETTLRLKDGETQMLAGLIQNEERNSADKVPGIADLPIVGRLFSNNNTSKNNTEIVLLITPKITRNLMIPHGAEASEFTLGTQTGNRSPEVLSGAELSLPVLEGSGSNYDGNQSAVAPVVLEPTITTETLESSLPPPPTSLIEQDTSPPPEQP